jgi:hypothetical protein
LPGTETKNRQNRRGLKELKIRQNELLTQANIFRKSLNDYDSLKEQKEGGGLAVNDVRNNQSNALQLQGDAVQRLINLGSQNKDVEFRQELTLKRLHAEVKATTLEMEISRLTRRIQAHSTTTGTEQKVTAELTAYAKEILDQLKGVSVSIKTIQTVQMSKFTDDDGLLYIGSNVSKKPASSLSKWFAIPGALLVMIFSGWIVLLGLRRYGMSPKPI